MKNITHIDLKFTQTTDFFAIDNPEIHETNVRTIMLYIILLLIKF